MGLDLAVANAVAHWLAMAEARGWETEVRPGWTAVRATDGHRVLVTARPDDPEALTRELLGLFRDWDTRQLTLEDPYLALDLGPYGCESALTMPVMVRNPAPVAPSTRLPRPRMGETGASQALEPAGTPEAWEAVDEPDLAAVERVVVEGFPVPHLLPWRRGGQFPAGYAQLPGRRSWLARVGGEPAAACITMDDGAAVGVYWMATLPELRSRGAAGAVLRTALAAHPERPATLTATLLGEPLYRRLGFTERAVARWWRYPSTPAALRR
ncbi:GNAT superfamily N-acetyltransferase [Streptacidiphilus sp. BW17]|uniref:GNAT family N-acetyltransferase n=1 Tax=Streptacidiphilus sp. BW17 TaxID=3156274 RepID=UPI0035180259